MNIFSGLEKYGLGIDKNLDIFEDENKQEATASAKAAAGPKEEDFILEKSCVCRICDKPFKSKMVKTTTRRLEPDFDLRPRFQFIDTLKYDIISCPFCGYTAMSRFFNTLNSTQVNLIKEQICANFTPANDDSSEVFTYDQAIDRYKLALVNTITKKGKASEKAYICLRTAWLLRGKIEGMSDGAEKEKAIKEEEVFYNQAYEGFMIAVQKETFPMCGMDETTVDYLMACMAFKIGNTDVALKILSRVILSKTVGKRMKEIAIDLKEDILAKKGGSN